MNVNAPGASTAPCVDNLPGVPDVNTKTATSSRLWWVLGILCAVSFGVLGLIGGEIYRQAPPLPAVVVSQAGRREIRSASALGSSLRMR